MWAPSKLQKWRDALARGEVVAAPAEGLYGYVCDPMNEKALRQLLKLKERPADKGLIVLCRHLGDVARFVDMNGPYRGDIEAAIKQYWPGAYTLVMPAKENIPDLLTGYRPTIAIRIPDCDYMNEYLNTWGGPLVSTSLNLSGQPGARRAAEIPHGVIHLAHPNPLSGKASQIFNVVTGEKLR